MGLTYVTAVVEAIDAKQSAVEARFLVDTGAIDCLMPRALLQRAGVQPDDAELYELADGQILRFDTAWARLRFMGSEVHARVVFGPEDAEPILGVVALELAGLVVDPKTNTLRKLAARSLKKSTAARPLVVAGPSETLYCKL